jgi:hypothetical protein
MRQRSHSSGGFQMRQRITLPGGIAMRQQVGNCEAAAIARRGNECGLEAERTACTNLQGVRMALRVPFDRGWTSTARSTL